MTNKAFIERVFSCWWWLDRAKESLWTSSKVVKNSQAGFFFFFWRWWILARLEFLQRFDCLEWVAVVRRLSSEELIWQKLCLFLSEDESEDPVVVKMALQVCREDLTKVQVELNRLQAEYSDVVPQRDWDNLSHMHEETSIKVWRKTYICIM